MIGTKAHHTSTRRCRAIEESRGSTTGRDRVSIVWWTTKATNRIKRIAKAKEPSTTRFSCLQAKVIDGIWVQMEGWTRTWTSSRSSIQDWGFGHWIKHHWICKNMPLPYMTHSRVVEMAILHYRSMTIKIKWSVTSPSHLSWWKYRRLLRITTKQIGWQVKT